MVPQDVERQADGPALQDGGSRSRLPSVHDSEMRHGRKSSRNPGPEPSHLLPKSL